MGLLLSLCRIYVAIIGLANLDHSRTDNLSDVGAARRLVRAPLIIVEGLKIIYVFENHHSVPISDEIYYNVSLRGLSWWTKVM